jgi:hypothetical protein
VVIVVIAVMPVVVVVVVARRRATLVLVLRTVAWPDSFGPYPAADRRESETHEDEGVAVPAND